LKIYTIRLFKTFLFQKAVFAFIILNLTILSCATRKPIVKSLNYKNSSASITFKNSELIKVQSNVYGNKELLSLLDNHLGKIYIYNYKSKKMIDSIDVKLRKNQYLFNYELLDRKQILLSINSTYLKDMHDSAICIIDRNKKIIKNYSFNNTPAPSYNLKAPYAYRSQQWSYSIHTNFPIKLNKKDSTVSTTLAPFVVLTCDSVAGNNKRFVYNLSAKKNSPAKELDFKIPNCSNYFNSKNEVIAAPYGDYAKDGRFIFGFHHSSQLISPTKIVEPDLHLYKVLEKNNFLKYKRLVHDPYRKCFWWVIEIESKMNAENAGKDFYNFYVVQLNEELKVLSEGFMPVGSSQYIIPLQEGLMIKNQNKSDSLALSYYDVYIPQFSDFKLDSLKSQKISRNKDINQDLKNFISVLKGDSSDKMFLILSLDRMPPEYAKILMNKLIEYQKKFSRNSIHIFTSDENKVPIELKKLVHIHRYNVIMRNFVWPTILEDRNTKDNVKVTEYPSNNAEQLMRKISDWSTQ